MFIHISHQVGFDSHFHVWGSHTNEGVRTGGTKIVDLFGIPLLERPRRQPMKSAPSKQVLLEVGTTL